MSDVNPISYKLITNAQTNSFVMDSFIKSHHNDIPFKYTPNALYKPEAIKFINYILNKSLVMLTYLDNEPNTYFSFVIYEYKDKDLIVHYAYTKSPFRRKGLIVDTIKLIQADPNAQIVITQYPKSPKVFTGFQSKFQHIVFDPFYHSRRI